MTDVALDELARIAMAATPGRWRLGTPNGHCFKRHAHGVGTCDYRITGYDDSTVISIDVPLMSPCDSAPIVVMPDEYNEGPAPVDAAYIVAAQPETILSLIQRIREQEERIREMEWHLCRPVSGGID